MSTLKAIVAELRALKKEFAAMRKAQATEWPKTPAQFAEYVGRSVRTVQAWIDAGKLRANTEVRPALITRGNAELFLDAK